MRDAGKKNNPRNHRPLLLVGLYCFSLFVFFLMAFPDFIDKHKTFSADQVVSLALDFEDLVAISQRENRNISKLLKDITGISVRALAFPSMGSNYLENIIRQNGLNILWKQNEMGSQTVLSTLSRFQSGDGVLPSDESAFGYPGYLAEVAEAINGRHGFLPSVEFNRAKGSGRLMKLTRGRWIKTHILFLEETLDPKFNLWKARLVRAASERGMRLLLVRLSPSARWDESRQFLSNLQDGLRVRGFSVGPMTAFEWRGETAHFQKFRLPIIFLLGFIGPVMVILLVQHLPDLHPIILYLLSCVISLWAGVCMNAWGSTPDMIFGLQSLRGTKILLMGPLLCGGWLLLEKEERHRLLGTNIKLKHLLIGGIFIGLMGGLYLMRSGNFPIVKVTDSERIFRDGLEHWLGARPRFKEIFFGHIFFILGLFLKRKNSASADFMRDGRFLIWLGLIGQISIINTFVHFHIPIKWGILRTMHGIWLGALLSCPFLIVMPKFMNRGKIV